MTDKEKLIQDTLQFCSKDAMNIEGLDREAIDELVEKGVVTRPEDVMALHLDLVMKPGPYEKFKTSNVPIIYESVERAKKQAKPENILYSMCIPGVTPEMAKGIIKEAGDLLYVLYPSSFSALFDILRRVECVGQELAYDTCVWMAERMNCTVNLKTRYYGVGIELFPEA